MAEAVKSMGAIEADRKDHDHAEGDLLVERVELSSP